MTQKQIKKELTEIYDEMEALDREREKKRAEIKALITYQFLTGSVRGMVDKYVFTFPDRESADTFITNQGKKGAKGDRGQKWKILDVKFDFPI